VSLGILAILICWGVPASLAQQGPTGQGEWQPATVGSSDAAHSQEEVASNVPARATGTSDPVLGQRLARVTTGSGTLPNEHGQIWREYDIRPYTLRVTTTNRPEQALVDWILEVTGHEVWHTDPLGLFNASADTLRVYHTPQMQKVVADIVDRFVSSEAQTEAMALSIVTLDSPTWRGKAHDYLHPLPLQSSGGQAWMLTREDYARLSNDLARRSDYQKYSSQGLVVTNGQPTIVSSRRPRSYVRDVQPRPEVWPGYVTDSTTLEEGYYLEFVPLLSLDRQWIEANLEIEITLVEKMLTFVIDMRWPRDHVFLLDLGMVPMPKMDQKQETFFEKLASPLTQSRANVLVFIESRGHLGEASPSSDRSGQSAPATVSRPFSPTRHGRTQPQAPSSAAGGSPQSSSTSNGSSSRTSTLWRGNF
jgi:hypothetical protein